MIPQIERAPRPFHPLRARLDRRWLEWTLAFLYAVLLVAVIWRLDHGDLSRDVTPVPSVADAVARAQALMLGFTEPLRRAPRESLPLSGRQSMPEGWSLWTGALDEPTSDRTVTQASPH